MDDSHRFAGMELDSEHGLYHTLFRQYSPSLGRWLGTDPVRGCAENPQGLNLYPYVRNNPANLIDPRGDQIQGSDCSDFTFATTHAECGTQPVLYSPNVDLWEFHQERRADRQERRVGIWTYCYCDKILGRTRSGLLGCVYVCSCADGTTVTLRRRCNKVDPYANLKCPAAIEAKCPRTVLLGTCTVVSPSPFCGPGTRVPPAP